MAMEHIKDSKFIIYVSMSGLGYLSLKFRPITTRLKHLVHASSHMAPYLPFLKENQKTKIRRLYSDVSDLKFIKTVNKQQKYLKLVENNTKIRSQKQELFTKKQECIDPCDVKLIPWYLLVFLAILYWFIETGIIIAFGEVAFEAELQSPAWLLVGCIFLIILLLDIFIQFRVGFLSKGIIVKNKLRVRSRYVNYPIIIDISVFLILFLALATQLYAINYVKMVVILKFVRMFEIDRYVMRMLLVEYTLKVIYVILKQVVVIIIISHVIGIFYFMLDNYLLTTDVCLSSNSKFCWLNNAVAYSPVSQLSWQIQYFYSFYWGVNTVTNISYGDLAPQNPYQTVYSLVCFILSLVLIGYIINQIVEVILKNIYTKEDYRENLVTYTSYMDLLGVEKDDQFQTKEVLYQRYTNRQFAVADQELMYKLPSDIKNQYFQKAYNKMYRGIEFILQGKADLVKIMCALKEVNFSKEESILVQGATVDGLYYLSRGKVKLFCQLKGREHELASIQEQCCSFLYCYQFFTKSKASYSTISESKALAYFVPQSIFQNLAKQNELMTQTLCLLGYQLLYNNKLDRVLENCFLCGYQHRWNECNIKLVDKKGIKLNLKTIQKLKEGARVIKRKHSIWKEKENLQKLKQIVKKHKDPVLMALEKKIMQIRLKVLSNRSALEVDKLYEWSIFLPDFNISSVRQKYNKLNQRNSLIRFKQF